MAKSAPAPRPFTLQALFRASLVLIPLGVLGNLLFSLLTTDRALLASLGHFPRGYLLLAVGLAFLPWLTNTLRLLIWARFLGSDLDVRDSFRITLATQLGSAVTPTAAGGEIFRIGLLVQRGISPGVAFSISTLASLEDGLFFLLSLPVALLVLSTTRLPDLPQIGLAAGAEVGRALGGLVAVLFAAWVLWRLVAMGSFGERARDRGLRWVGRTRRRLRQGWEETRAAWRLVVRRGKARFALTFLLTAIQWTARYSVITALAAFLGVRVDPFLFFALQWVVFTLMSFVPTPGAAGGAEAAFYLVFSAVLPRDVIGIATGGWRFLTFYLQLALGAALFTLLNALAARDKVRSGESGKHCAPYV